MSVVVAAVLKFARDMHGPAGERWTRTPSGVPAARAPALTVTEAIVLASHEAPMPSFLAAVAAFGAAVRAEGYTGTWAAWLGEPWREWRDVVAVYDRAIATEAVGASESAP